MLVEPGGGQSSDVRHRTRVEGAEPRRCVLFPTDFGPAARRAWPYALRVARVLAAELVVLHVLEPTAADFENPAGAIRVDMIAASLQRTCQAALGHLRAEAADAGIAVRTRVVVGRVRRAIVRAAIEEHAWVVIVATRRATISSGVQPRRHVAEWVAAHAACSVWVVCSVIGRERCAAPHCPERQDHGHTLPAAGRERDT